MKPNRWSSNDWDDLDRWVIAVSIARPDGVRVRRYVKELHGPHATLTPNQTEALRFDHRRDADQSTCDVRLCFPKWHPVRMVRLTRALEDRAKWALESRGGAE